MEKIFYPVVFHSEDDGGYSTRVPDIDGCFSEGNTLAEAYSMITDAIGLCVEDFQERHIPLPAASNPADIHVDKPDFIALIEFDPVAYAKRHDTKAVKKTLTIPSWLNQIAEEKHINFSAVLQDALKSQLDVI